MVYIYKEFRVIIENLGQIRIIKPRGEMFSGTVQLDRLKEQTIELLNNSLKDGEVKKRELLVVLGSHLFTMLFDDKTQNEFKEEYNKVRNVPSTFLRLKLEFTPQARTLAELPWEYLYFPDSYREKGFFIAADPRLILTRHVPLRLEFKDLKPDEKPLRILIVVSQPSTLGTVQTAPVIEAIESLGNQFPGSIQVDKLLQPTKRSLVETVKNLKPNVVHFLGHGKYTKDGGHLAFIKESDQDKPLWLNDKTLADCFIYHQPRLIFLHACEGAYTESYSAFSGVALQLVYTRVPAVIAMQYPVTNYIACTFAKKFYKSLGEGRPIDVAVQDGRLELAMYLEEEASFNSWAFGSPVVYLQSAEGIILHSETQ